MEKEKPEEDEEAEDAMGLILKSSNDDLPDLQTEEPAEN